MGGLEQPRQMDQHVSQHTAISEGTAMTLTASSPATVLPDAGAPTY